MATRKQAIKDYLKSAGFLPFETKELSQGYNLTQFRKLPYLQNIVKTRRLYISNAKSRGLSNEAIKEGIIQLYIKKDWIKDGELESWDMIRDARKKAIDSGEYFPVKRKGSHHGEGVSKGDVLNQKKRNRHLSNEQKIINLNAQIDKTDDANTKSWLIELRNGL